MKKIYVIGVLLFGIILKTFAQGIPLCIIAPFSAIGNISSDDADAATELFTSQLVMDNKFRIVERRNLEHAYEEFNWQLSDWSNNDKIQQFGNKLNAKYVIRGQLIRMGDNYFLSANILDLDSFEIVSSTRKQFNDLGNILNILPDFVSELTDSLIPKKQYQIGDRGPGGGIIFRVDGNKYSECSYKLGESNIEDAFNISRHYNGGNYNDWALPTIYDLQDIYWNLKQKGIVYYDEIFWTETTHLTINTKYVMRFSDGSVYKIYAADDVCYAVLAVRTFSE